MTNFIESIKEGFSVILEYLDVDDNDDYYDDDREEHFGIVSLTLMFVTLAAITAIPCLADLI